MFYIVKFKSEDDENEFSEPLWTATVMDPAYNPEDPDALCRTREDALKVFGRIKASRRIHHIRLFECESDENFDWAFGKDITPKEWSHV